MRYRSTNPESTKDVGDIGLKNNVLTQAYVLDCGADLIPIDEYVRYRTKLLEHLGINDPTAAFFDVNLRTYLLRVTNLVEMSPQAKANCSKLFYHLKGGQETSSLVTLDHLKGPIGARMMTELESELLENPFTIGNSVTPALNYVDFLIENSTELQHKIPMAMAHIDDITAPKAAFLNDLWERRFLKLSKFGDLSNIDQATLAYVLLRIRSSFVGRLDTAYRENPSRFNGMTWEFVSFVEAVKEYHHSKFQYPDSINGKVNHVLAIPVGLPQDLPKRDSNFDRGNSKVESGTDQVRSRIDSIMSQLVDLKEHIGEPANDSASKEALEAAHREGVDAGYKKANSELQVSIGDYEKQIADLKKQLAGVDETVKARDRYAREAEDLRKKNRELNSEIAAMRAANAETTEQQRAWKIFEELFGFDQDALRGFNEDELKKILKTLAVGFHADRFGQKSKGSVYLPIWNGHISHLIREKQGQTA